MTAFAMFSVDDTALHDNVIDVNDEFVESDETWEVDDYDPVYDAQYNNEFDDEVNLLNVRTAAIWCLKHFFKDKQMFNGGPIPESLLLAERNIFGTVCGIIL